MTLKYDLVAVGGATEDRFFTVDDYALIDNPGDVLRKRLLAFEYGGKVGVTSINTAFGGGASNAAVAAARLGFRTAFIGAVGKDESGKAIRANLRTNKVNVHGLESTAKSATGVSYVVVTPSHEHVAFTYRGANSELRLPPASRRIMNAAALTYITSLSGQWQKTLKTIFASSNLIAWNPGRLQLAAGFKMLKPFLAETDILICNRDEALELAIAAFGKKTVDDPRHLLHALRSLGPDIVVITNGGHGADAYDGQNYHFQKAVKATRPIDTTGVGDAFGATFVVALIMHNGSLAKALALAAKNAAAVVSAQGAQKGLLRLK